MNSTNDCSDDTISPCNNRSKNLIQTELSSLDVKLKSIERSPGENVQVDLNVSDERDSPTIAFLKIDIVADNDTKTVGHFTYIITYV